MPEQAAEALGITLFELFTRALLYHAYFRSEHGVNAYSPRAVSIAYTRYRQCGAIPVWLSSYLKTELHHA
jgi:hypothetical protein